MGKSSSGYFFAATLRVGHAGLEGRYAGTIFRRWKWHGGHNPSGAGVQMDVQLSFRRERITDWRINLGVPFKVAANARLQRDLFLHIIQLEIVESHSEAVRSRPASIHADEHFAIGCRILRDREIEQVSHAQIQVIGLTRQ